MSPPGLPREIRIAHHCPARRAGISTKGGGWRPRKRDTVCHLTNLTELMSDEHASRRQGRFHHRCGAGPRPRTRGPHGAGRRRRHRGRHLRADQVDAVSAGLTGKPRSNRERCEGSWSSDRRAQGRCSRARPAARGRGSRYDRVRSPRHRGRQRRNSADGPGRHRALGLRGRKRCGPARCHEYRRRIHSALVGRIVDHRDRFDRSNDAEHHS